VTDEELIEELSFPVYRRVSTMIFVPGNSASSVEMVAVDPQDLQAAQEWDLNHGSYFSQPELTDQTSAPYRDLKTRERVCLSCNSSQRQTLDCMTYTQRLLNKIPPPTLWLFINLSTIAAIAIIGLALVTR
jgi:hypothetical protein